LTLIGISVVDQVDGNGAVLSQAGMNETYQIVYNRLIQFGVSVLCDTLSNDLADRQRIGMKVMKRSMTLTSRFYTALFLMMVCITSGSEAADLPRVHIIGTGGTIASGMNKLSADDLVSSVPKLKNIATISTDDFINIGSSRMTPTIQFRLANEVNRLFKKDKALAGIVITHGTDSIEETAFFLDLLIRDERPVVFTAAQRPPVRIDTDGPRNLTNAVLIASKPSSRDRGVLLTLNDDIHAARDVRKTHTTAVEAFRSERAGKLGYVDSDRVYYVRDSADGLTLTPERIEAKVDLIRLVAGSDGHLIRAAIEYGAKGIVVEVFGRGNVPEPVTKALREALEKKVVVVFTSRTGNGRVLLYPPFNKMGIVTGEGLDGLKARMLLVAALGVTDDPARIQGFYTQLSGLVK
jgi:L-asparaginase